MSRIESKKLLDSERSSSDDSLEDGLPGYARNSANRSSRFSRAWEHRGPWIARHLDKLSTKGRPAGARGILVGSGIRRILSVTIAVGACFWLVFWAFQPLFQRSTKVLWSNSAVPISPGTLNDVRALDSLLPQHNPDLTWPEGRNGRYLNFPHHSWGAGWNNIVREQMLQAYVSNLSRRAFVIPPYIAHEHRPFGGDQDLFVPSSAFSYSPLTGAPFPGSRGYGDSDPPNEQVLPRSVSEEYYNSVCPEDRRIKLDVREVCKELGLNVDEDDVKVVAHAWAKKLLAMEDSCVDVINHPLFDYMVFSDRILSLWHDLSKSPLLARWDWSPLIYTEVARAGFPVPTDTVTARLRSVLPPTHPWASSHSTDVATSSTQSHHPRTPFIIPGLIAVHARRGDYEQHCKSLSSWRTEYGYWSAFGTYSTSKPAFPKGVPHHKIRPDRCDPTFPKLNDTLYDPPYARVFPRNQDGTVDPTTLTLEQLILYHCWQDLDAIRDRLHDVREWQKKRGRELRDVYVLTNGSNDWIWALKELLKEDGWMGEIKTSKDIAPTMTVAGISVNQGVDMAIAHWSEVFLGNGFSSLSSNTVGFKLAQGYPTDSIHFF